MKEGSRNKTIQLILYNIRSAYNVGSIFRTADAAGVSKIYLIGVTPEPIDRFGRKRRDIEKTALGAEDFIPWEHHKNIKRLIKKLKAEGVYIIALEQSPKSVSYKKVRVRRSIAFIAGNEIRGIPKDVLKQSDVVAEIPMKGKKESLNVSVAVGIALFSVC